jgi:hypothetical protein
MAFIYFVILHMYKLLCNFTLAHHQLRFFICEHIPATTWPNYNWKFVTIWPGIFYESDSA